MTPLPARPNLEQLKKQAKSLLRAAQEGRIDALDRFAALPSLASRSREDLASTIALHDAQSVIAREHGFDSWATLRDEVEARTLSFDAALDEFVRCATGGASGRAERLLALHPAIASATLYTALVLGDAASVETRLSEHPELATRAGGPQQWEPLLYICHTCLHRSAPGRLDGLIRIARSLVARGANPNAEYHWTWHPELPRTALWGSICAVGSLALAGILLEAGANPTDGVTTHIAGGSGNIEALELLRRFGVDVDGIPGGVPPLVYMMEWADAPAGPFWLLDHGADPNLAWGPAGEAPLHVAARRWNLAMVEAIVSRGGDVNRRRADQATPHTLAELNGNREVAAWLLGHGALDELSPLDRFVAACARADLPSARAMLATDPSLPRQLGRDQHLMLQRHAETGNIAALETMLACGFDPNVGDKDRVTSLHRAAMRGRVDAVRVLLAAGADVNALDGMFAASPMVWAVEGRRHPRPGADHVGVARLLLAARSPVTWTVPEGAPDPESTLDGLTDLVRAASTPVSQ